MRLDLEPFESGVVSEDRRSAVIVQGYKGCCTRVKERGLNVRTT